MAWWACWDFTLKKSRLNLQSRTEIKQQAQELMRGGFCGHMKERFLISHIRCMEKFNEEEAREIEMASEKLRDILLDFPDLFSEVDAVDGVRD